MFRTFTCPSSGVLILNHNKISCIKLVLLYLTANIFHDSGCHQLLEFGGQKSVTLKIPLLMRTDGTIFQVKNTGINICNVMQSDK